MKFGAIIIGDEILSGKRKDGHLAKTIETLGARGLQLAWSHYLGDDPDLITATLRRTFDSGDAVFSFGGIGATPDDHTRAAGGPPRDPGRPESSAPPDRLRDAPTPLRKAARRAPKASVAAAPT
jgi:probable molybdopterin binding protein